MTICTLIFFICEYLGYPDALISPKNSLTQMMITYVFTQMTNQIECSGDLDKPFLLLSLKWEADVASSRYIKPLYKAKHSSY